MPTGNPDVDRVIAVKGEPISTVVRDPMIDEMMGGVSTGRKIPNPAPTKRLTFGDGTYLDLKTEAMPGPVGSSASTVPLPEQVVGGTALKDVEKADKPDKPGYHTMPDGSLAVEDPAAPGGLRVVATKPQGPQQAEAQPIHTLPSGEQVTFNPATGKWDHFADAKPAVKPTGNAPALNLPATRPGQLTDLSLVEAQANQFIAGVNADTNLSPEQRQAKINTYLTTVVQPAAAQATKEANDYAVQQQQRQREADARAARTENRQGTVAERQARTAEAQQRLNEEKFSYERGQDAVSNRLKLLQNEVDPSFGPALAGIYNRIIPGAFQPGSFTTATPDLDALAAAHVGPLVDMHEQTAQQAGPAVPAGYPAPTPPPVPPAYGPRTMPPTVPYPQPGGTGVVGRFGQ